MSTDEITLTLSPDVAGLLTQLATETEQDPCALAASLLSAVLVDDAQAHEDRAAAVQAIEKFWPSKQKPAAPSEPAAPAVKTTTRDSALSKRAAALFREGFDTTAIATALNVPEDRAAYLLERGKVPKNLQVGKKTPLPQTRPKRPAKPVKVVAPVESKPAPAPAPAVRPVDPIVAAAKAKAVQPAPAAPAPTVQVRGYSPPPKRVDYAFSPAQDATIRGMRAAFNTPAEIANRMGVPLEDVRRRISELWVKR